MKIIIVIFGLILFISCEENHNTANFFEIKLTKKAVIGISPDSLQIEEMKLKYGGDDFYTVADDVMWYNGQMLQVIDSLKINYIHTDRRRIKIITPIDTVEINTDASEIKWRYFYYNGNKILGKDVFDIIDMSKFFK